ncbi:unnamed protein product [Ambrosiozyma monospora]|uniref:Unnamed protein product n=1 Tax=Ambrosiozyma monospora TaxID=43982 RepID=A0ACB5TCD5_AMBMO|nr:unnamed protein product [Ambrosiozyma monospora]
MIKNLRVFRLVVLKDFNSSHLKTSLESSGLYSSQIEKSAVEIKTFTKNSKLFQNPLILAKLGNWILECCAELDNELLPLVIASLDEDADTYLVCGLPPKYPNMKGVANEADFEQNRLTILNTFSLAFQQIATETGAKARIDSFESSLIELRKEDLSNFLEKLSLSGLV